MKQNCMFTAFFSYFPIFSFWRIDDGIVFSLFSVVFGNRRFSIGNFKKVGNKKQLTFFYRRYIVNTNINCENSKKVKKMCKKYRAHIGGSSKIERDVECQALRYRIGVAQGRMSVSDTKATVSAAILVAFLPLFLDYKNFFKDGMPAFIKFIFFFLLYYYFNAIFLLFLYFYPSGSDYASFKDLKQAKDRVIEWNIQLYFDWLKLRDYADMKVSLVSVILTYIFYIFVLGSIILLLNVRVNSLSGKEWFLGLYFLF